MSQTATAPSPKLDPKVAFIYHLLAYLTLVAIGVVCFYLAASRGWLHFYPAGAACAASLIVLLIDGAKGKWGLKIKGADGKYKSTEVKAKFIVYSTWAMIALIAIWVVALIVGFIVGM